MPLSCIYLIQCFSNENFDMFNFDLICVLVKRDCSCSPKIQRVPLCNYVLRNVYFVQFFDNEVSWRLFLL